jgi:valine--pyruvate aminotransferase
MSSEFDPSSFSLIGQKLTGHSGIVELMDDLGRAMTIDPEMRMLGGGNPAPVPQMQQLLRTRMRELLDANGDFDRMLGNYDPPQGNPRFLAALARLLSETYGWRVGPENLAITAGGQTALFFLFNILAGKFAGNVRKKILLPLMPEYIGYADQMLEDELFVGCRPEITWPHGEASRTFKYRIDFTAVDAALAQGNIGAIAASRPTNPTGNVLTDDEVRHLSRLAAERGIPLILDNAYGTPFPNVLYVPAEPHWDEHVVLTLSLSKLGLPGTRTGIVIAPAAIAKAVQSLTAIIGLANTNVGQQLVLPWVESGEILRLGPDVLRPYYAAKVQTAENIVREIFTAAGVNWAVHATEGAFFNWLWLRDLQIPTRELYERLKRRKVLVVPGEYFFFGLKDDWPHRHQCLRINISGTEQTLREGLKIIAEEAQRAS